jgi:hypothetical protein
MICILFIQCCIIKHIILYIIDILIFETVCGSSMNSVFGFVGL